MPNAAEPVEPVEPEPVPVAVGGPSGERLETLQASLQAAHEMTRQHRRDFDVIRAETAALRERTVELRSRRSDRLQRLREVASARAADRDA
jgi:hypothetical protein